MVEPDRLQMKTWLTHNEFWITKATNTHSEYVILTVFHINNGWVIANQCYVVCKLSVLFNLYVYQSEN